LIVAEIVLSSQNHKKTFNNPLLFWGFMVILGHRCWASLESLSVTSQWNFKCTRRKKQFATVSNCSHHQS